MQAAKADLLKSQAQLENAAATEQRKRMLVVSHSSSQASLDNAERARAATQAVVAQAQATLAKATERLSYTQVKSDFDGVVTAGKKVDADVGQVVSPGQTVLTVARPDVREAVVDVGQNLPAEFEGRLPSPLVCN